jgi:hypothetical protein
VILFWAALAVALKVFGASLARITGWRSLSSRYRILIGAGLVWLTGLVIGGAFVAALLMLGM